MATRPPLGANMSEKSLGERSATMSAGGVALAAALVGGLGGDEHQALVGSTAAEAETHDGERAIDVLVGGDDALRALGPAQWCTRANEIALIFLRNESSGHAAVDPYCGPEAAEEDQQQQVAQLQCAVNDARVSLRHPADGGVRAVNESGEGARQRADVEEVELVGTGFFTAQQHGRERRRKCERVEGRDGDGKCDGERELPVEDAGGAGEERHGHEDGDEYERGGDDRAGDLAHGVRRSLMRVGMLHGDVTLHVLDDDDGVPRRRQGRWRA